MHSETLEKELHIIKWKDFDELQANEIENINFEMDNLLSNLEDIFINTAGKVLRKNLTLVTTQKHGIMDLFIIQSRRYVYKYCRISFKKKLYSGDYSETWNHGNIHSVHKNGSKKDPSNY